MLAMQIIYLNAKERLRCLNSYSSICFRLIIVFLITPILFSCEKDEGHEADPIANFGYKFQESAIDTSAEIVFPTCLNIVTANNSENANQFSWDLGDGRILDTKESVFSYDVSGTYIVALTATNGQESNTQSKKIIVKDRKIKSITIKHLYWNTSFHTLLNWDDNKKADLFIRIYKSNDPGIPEVIGEQYDAAVYFQSKDIPAVSISDIPLSISVSEDVTLESPGCNDLFGYCLYARDSGKEFLIFSNWGSGTMTFFTEEYSTKLSTLSISFNGSQIEMNAEF